MRAIEAAGGEVTGGRPKEAVCRGEASGGRQWGVGDEGKERQLHLREKAGDRSPGQEVEQKPSRANPREKKGKRRMGMYAMHAMHASF